MDFSVVILAVGIGLASSAKPYVEVKNTSPTVLDSPVLFRAQLHNAGNVATPLVFRWSDNASPAHFREESVDGTSANLTLVYSSGKYEPATYTMTVMVFTTVNIFREEVASAKSKFAITQYLSGHLTVDDNHSKEGKHLVSTLNATSMSVKLHDPLEFLSTARVSYDWYINGTHYGMTEDPGGDFDYQFASPGISRLEVSVVAFLSQNDSSGRTGSLQSASPSTASADLAASNSSPDVKKGVFRASLESRTPVSHLSVSGDTWLKHGALLDLSVTCDGTGPWSYCWSINSDYNVTGNETCVDPELLEGRCAFPVVWYFRQAGTHDILLQVTNDVGGILRKVIHVNIYDVHKQTPIAFVVIPVCSALAAAVVVATGVFAFLSYKRNLSVEIADFDFNPAGEEDDGGDLEYRTFWERLRDSMVNTFVSTSDTISHVSSASSRSGAGYQPNNNSGVNIHYGSIT